MRVSGVPSGLRKNAVWVYAAVLPAQKTLQRSAMSAGSAALKMPVGSTVAFTWDWRLIACNT